MTLDEVATFLGSLDRVTIGERWNHRTWSVGDHGFAWHRPFSKADVTRFGDEPPPDGDILAVVVENLDAKDALLGMGLPGFFTIPHFDGYAAILIQLRRARKRDVRGALIAAHAIASARPPKKRRAAKKTPSA